MATTFSSVIRRSAWFCPVAGLPWLSPNTTSTLAPPRPASPAFFASGKLPNSGWALLMISIATSIAALVCSPALAAPPESGNTAPILMVFSCENALPAERMEIEAAKASPAIRLKFILDRLRELPPASGSYGPMVHSDPPHPLFLLTLSALHGPLAGAMLRPSSPRTAGFPENRQISKDFAIQGWRRRVGYPGA